MKAPNDPGRGRPRCKPQWQRVADRPPFIMEFDMAIHALDACESRRGVRSFLTPGDTTLGKADACSMSSVLVLELLVFQARLHHRDIDVVAFWVRHLFKSPTCKQTRKVAKGYKRMQTEFGGELWPLSASPMRTHGCQ